MNHLQLEVSGWIGLELIAGGFYWGEQSGKPLRNLGILPLIPIKQ